VEVLSTSNSSVTVAEVQQAITQTDNSLTQFVTLLVQEEQKQSDDKKKDDKKKPDIAVVDDKQCK
jgi:hypothetical protein